MTNFIAEAFKRIVGLFAGAAFILSLMFGVATWTASGGAWQGWLALIGSPLAVIFMFGTLSLIIQNNQLLRRIADSQQQAGEGRAEPERRARERIEPTLRASR